MCTSSYGHALKQLGESIDHALQTRCLVRPPLTRSGALACSKGDVIGSNASGSKVVCKKDCLPEADLMVSRITAKGKTLVPRCPAALFDAAISAKSCGTSCPCWRLMPSKKCQALAGSSPYAVEIVDTATTPMGSYASVCGALSSHTWGSPQLADLPRCQ